LPFEWLSTCSLKGIKTRWNRAIAGTGICPICHRAEKLWHVPANCPLLKELNLKLVSGPPSLAPGPAPTPSPAPAPLAPTPSPSPRGWVALADNQSISRSVCSPSAPSGLMASVAEDDFDFDQEFCWTGDEDGFEYSPSVGSSSRKSNTRVAPYLSCFQVSLMSSSPSSASVEFFLPSASRSSSTADTRSPHSISPALQSLLQRLSHSSISPDLSCCLAIADSGATNHMFPYKSAFISYKTTSGLKVQMGNNSYLSWAAALPLSPLTDSGFLFGMFFMSRVL
jgi:hypothetical protein